MSIIRTDQQFPFLSQLAGRQRTHSRTLHLEMIESNREISQFLKLPIATPVYYLRCLCLLDEVPSVLERCWIVQKLAPGFAARYNQENSDVCDLLKHAYSFSFFHGEEEISIVAPSPEEQVLLPSQEYVRMQGVLLVNETTPVVYYDHLALPELYIFSAREGG